MIKARTSKYVGVSISVFGGDAIIQEFYENLRNKKQLEGSGEVGVMD